MPRKTTAAPVPAKKPTRIQLRNRKRILEAALDVFSRDGFRGATLDQIAAEAGLSKPNILYYFEGKEDIHVTLLNQQLDTWLDPLVAMDPGGDPLTEILDYVQRKLDMAREFPRESRLFAGEILRGAPYMAPYLKIDFQPLFDEKCRLVQGWMQQGRLQITDPQHLMFSIWATTQHYADFAAQIEILQADKPRAGAGASAYLRQLYSGLLAMPAAAGLAAHSGVSGSA